MGSQHTGCIIFEHFHIQISYNVLRYSDMAKGPFRVHFEFHKVPFFFTHSVKIVHIEYVLGLPLHSVCVSEKVACLSSPLLQFFCLLMSLCTTYYLHRPHVQDYKHFINALYFLKTPSDARN